MVKKSQTPKSSQLQPPMRRNRAAPAGRDAGRLGAAAFARKGFSEPGLVLNWPQIAGPEVADIALPLKLAGGVLTLKTEPGAAAFLQLESRELLARIQAYLGHGGVTRLKFVQAPLMERPKPPPRPVIPSELSADDPAQHFQGRQNLRDALLKLARARHSRLIMR